MQLLLHALNIHQIELEMQNEELRRFQLKVETVWARYYDLYDLTPVGYLTLNERGVILEADLTASQMLVLPCAALVMTLTTASVDFDAATAV